MVRTDGLTHIQLTVRDRERSAAFYKQLLGMTEVRRGKTAVMLRTPGSRELFTINQPATGTERAGQMGGIAHFGFRMREPMEPAALALEITRAGGTPLEHGKRGGDEVYATCHDPDGYEVELFWAPE
jgi:catechol-2,3-dioxygenase